MSRMWDKNSPPIQGPTLPASTAARNPLRNDYNTVAMRFRDVFQLSDHVRDRGCSPQTPIASLGEALAGVANELDLPSTVDFRVVVSGRQRELSAGLRDEIYSIGREAIVNAFLHSGAREIEAEVEYRLTSLRIAVRDNGRGIDPEELRLGRNEPWGLQGMCDRAEKIGARLRLLSRVALGTEVELSVPCAW